MEMNVSIERQEIITLRRKRFVYFLVITKDIGIRHSIPLKGGGVEAKELISFGVKKDF